MINDDEELLMKVMMMNMTWVTEGFSIRTTFLLHRGWTPALKAEYRGIQNGIPLSLMVFHLPLKAVVFQVRGIDLVCVWQLRIPQISCCHAHGAQQLRILGTYTQLP